MTRAQKKKVVEEYLFWEKNYFNICINKQVPDDVPDNEEVIRLLDHFKLEHDYYAIMNRRSLVMRIYNNSFIDIN